MTERRKKYIVLESFLKQSIKMEDKNKNEKYFIIYTQVAQL